MPLDTLTLALLVAVAFILQSVTLFTFYLLANEYEGIGLAVLGNAVYGAGFAIVLVRSIMPDLVLVLVGIIFNLWGALLLTAGLAQFCRQRVSLRWSASLALFATLLAFYFTQISVNNNLRMLVVSLGLMILLGRAGLLLLLTPSPTPYRSAAILTGLPILVYAIFLGIRAFLVGGASRQQSLLDPDLPQVLFFVLIFISSSLWTSGFILMITLRLRHDLHTQARRDPLTGLSNRLAMQELLDGLFESAEHPTPGSQANDDLKFALLIIDVDHFKAVNDRYGHAGGDRVLKTVAERLQANLRSADKLARWGGEEFLAYLPATNAATAWLVGERLRQAIANEAIDTRHGPAQVTLCVGAAACSAKICTPDDLLRAADAALYSAKQKGRNRVAMAEE